MQLCLIISMHLVIDILSQRISLMEYTIESCFSVCDDVQKDTRNNESVTFDVRDEPR